jgi:hypothetical protein
LLSYVRSFPFSSLLSSHLIFLIYSHLSSLLMFHHFSGFFLCFFYRFYSIPYLLFPFSSCLSFFSLLLVAEINACFVHCPRGGASETGGEQVILTRRGGGGGGGGGGDGGERTVEQQQQSGRWLPQRSHSPPPHTLYKLAKSHTPLREQASREHVQTGGSARTREKHERTRGTHER